jgi:hypothetical protein
MEVRNIANTRSVGGVSAETFFLVEVSSGLIRQQYWRIIEHGPTYGDALVIQHKTDISQAGLPWRNQGQRQN